jgi:hypothetical protein
MAGAISGATIASMMAMMASAAMSYKANADATKRQNAQIRDSLARSQALQEQAEKKALDTAAEFNGDNRASNQAELEAQLTEEFIKPVESAQQINSAASTTQGAVSKDYDAAKTASDVNQMKVAQGLAKLLGKTTAAGRLRQNEALKMTDAASDIGTLASFARGRGRADEIAIQTAGRPDGGMQLAAGLLGAAGSAGMSGAFSGGTSGTVTGPGISAANTGLGMQATGGTGFKLPAKFAW